MLLTCVTARASCALCGAVCVVTGPAGEALLAEWAAAHRAPRLDAVSLSGAGAAIGTWRAEDE